MFVIKILAWHIRLLHKYFSVLMSIIIVTQLVLYSIIIQPQNISDHFNSKPRPQTNYPIFLWVSIKTMRIVLAVGRQTNESINLRFYCEVCFFQVFVKKFVSNFSLAVFLQCSSIYFIHIYKQALTYRNS